MQLMILGSRCFLAFTILLALTLNSFGACGQQKKSPCDKPPQIASQPSSPDDSAKLKMFKVVGTVILLIDEAGDVIETKIHSVHPEAARDSLIAVAKTVKFKTRPGCGTLQVVMVFNSDQPGRLKN
jgi:hypothetical protein